MIQNYGGSGTYSEDGKGGYIWRRNTQDGHGGRAEAHREEMEYIAEQIAEQVVQKRVSELIPEIQRAAYNQAYNSLVHELSFDVTSAVNIGIENGRSILNSRKTEKVVADAVIKEVQKQLKRKK